ELYLARAFDSVADYLIRRKASLPAALDPTGEVNLNLAKRLRRMAFREGVWRQPGRLAELVDEYFPLPTTPTEYWNRRMLPSQAAASCSTLAVARALAQPPRFRHRTSVAWRWSALPCDRRMT